MSKKEEIVWRLGKLPTPEEVISLVKDKIITQEEAREILFNTRTIEERDKKSLEAEIKFLRELVDRLSQDKSQITKYIKIIEPQWSNQPFFQPYITWCGTTGTTSINAIQTFY